MKPGTAARLFLLWFLSWSVSTPARAQLYVGVLGGISTLSGDTRSSVNSSSIAFSSYNPVNGGAVEVLAGKHLSDYFTVQASYVWNENHLTLTAANSSSAGQQEYQEIRSSSQQSGLGDVLVYFRARNSRLRPYLSVGTGFMHFGSSQASVQQVLPGSVLPAQHFTSNKVVLNVPVGMDINLGKAWVFRYTFSESISGNPISDRLSPPGQHGLKNFQNLFGVIRRF